LTDAHYETVCHLTEEMARDVVAAREGHIGWLYGEPK
jgi:hypothetical protein